MLFFVDIRVDAKDLELAELWDLWEQEVEAASGAVEAGVVRGIWKVAGEQRVLAVLDLPDHDALDRALMVGTPMAGHLVVAEITAVRDYASFGEDIKARWAT